MAANEPINLYEWDIPPPHKIEARLFTCGRPGRDTYGTAKIAVGEAIIDQWEKGLPQLDPLNIVSLLGHKKGGYSEFDYYPFRSSKEIGYKLTFEEWLNNRYHRRFFVHEFPTVDARGIPANILDEKKRQILTLLGDGATVVVIDSAGAERTARVCRSIGARRRM